MALPIQRNAPKECTLLELIAYVVMECETRGVRHSGQQQHIIREVLKEYQFADA